MVISFFLFSWAVVANSDEPQLLTPGKMSQRQGKEAYPTPTKDPHQPSLSPASPHSQGKKPQLEFLFVRRGLTFVVYTAFPPGFVQIRCCCLFCLDHCNRLSTPSFLLIWRLLDSTTHFVSCLILVNQVFFYFLVVRPPYIHKTMKISKRFCLCELHLLIFTITSINPMELENVCYQLN